MNKISLQTFKHTLRDIHANSEKRKLCFIIGAGASVKSGIPSGGQLSKSWYKEIIERYSKEEINKWEKEVKLNHEDLASSYGSIYRKRFENDKTSGYEFLINIMKDAKPSFGHIILAQILSKASGHCVITTNFDSLIETAIYQFSNNTPLVCGHESLSGYAHPSNIHPLIIKIHRDLLLSPKSDSDEIKELDEGWRDPLDKIFNSHIPIVIGYGGNDGSLMSYFESMNKPTNFFWCGHQSSTPSKRVIDLISKMDGRYIEIEGFDELMNELLWVFNEIGPIKDELTDITKDRITTFNKQWDIVNPEATINSNSEPKVIKNISAFQYSQIAQKEFNYEKRKAIYLEALEKFPNTAWLWNQFTYFLQWIKKDFNNLETYYIEALAVDPEHANNNGNYANFLHNIKKDYEKAEKYYLKALELDPENVYYNGNYANFLSYIKKDYEKAEKYYLKALELDSEHANNNGNYANFLYYIKKDYEKAEKYYLKAMELDPENAINNGNYANFLYYIKKDYEKAENYYIKAMELDPENAIINGNYAIFLHIIKKDNDKAEKYYLKALELDSEQANYNGNYANFLLITKRKNVATDYLEKANYLNNHEKNGLILELYFYRYAHYPEYIKTAESEIEMLLKEGIRSIGWDFDQNIEVAIKDGHPNPKKLRELADRITRT